jgi:hypothetical protein
VQSGDVMLARKDCTQESSRVMLASFFVARMDGDASPFAAANAQTRSSRSGRDGLKEHVGATVLVGSMTPGVGGTLQNIKRRDDKDWQTGSFDGIHFFDAFSGIIADRPAIDEIGDADGAMPPHSGECGYSFESNPVHYTWRLSRPTAIPPENKLFGNDSMEPAVFDDLKNSLDKSGAAAAIDGLCDALRKHKDYTGLFYARLMKKRHELGVSPIPTGSSQDLPAEVHAPYEDAIREAARQAGNLFLEDGNIPAAWAFFRMIGEPQPVINAIENFKPLENEDCHPVVDIAFNQGVHVQKGFDLIVDRYGICSAITTLGGHEFPPQSPEREYCIKRLVRALYDELKDRLTAEIEHKQGFKPTATTVRDLIAGRDWLFEDDVYHIDVSHLSAVIQMTASHLGASTELDLARELCAYGQKLSLKFQYQSDPPFEDQYKDYAIFLDILAGVNVDEGLAHFRRKAEDADPETIGTFPAEVLVNLLVRLDRPKDALTIARKFLSKVDDTRLSCPSVAELCQRTSDYAALAEVARAQGNAVHYVAGLIAAKQ